MNKFMRGCLLTALTMFIVGCAICLVCWMFGGFRQIDTLRGMANIPFFHYEGNGLHWSLGFGDDGEFGMDWEKERYLRIKDGETAHYQASSFRELDVELGACTLYLQESEDDQIYINVKGNRLKHYYLVDGSTLRIRNAGKTKLVGIGNISDQVYLKIPKDFVFDEADVTIGAGTLEGGALRAGDLSMEVGAGTCSLDEISGNEVSLDVGAGNINTKKLDAAQLKLNVGAGEFKLKGVSVTRELNLELGMGNAEIDGTVTGNMNVDCGMGNVTMRLTGSEDDHAYEVDCGMGSVEIGDRSYGGLATEQKWNSGQGSLFEIECNMGNVKLSFDK